MTKPIYTCAWCGSEQHYPWSVTIHGYECCGYECANKLWDWIDARTDP